MLSFTYLSLLSIASAALTFVAESSSEEVNGLSAYSVPEKSVGENTFFLGDKPEVLYYTGGYLKSGKWDNGFRHRVNIVDDIMVLSEQGETKFDVSTGYLQYNNDDQFTACKNIDDPVDHSADNFAITYGKTGDECFGIKLKAVNYSTSSTELKKRAVSGSTEGDFTILPVSESEGDMTILPISETQSTDGDMTILPISESTPVISTIDHTDGNNGPPISTPVISTVDHTDGNNGPPISTPVISTIDHTDGNNGPPVSTGEPTTVHTIHSSSIPPEISNSSSYDNGANRQMVGLSGLAIVGALLM